MENLIEPAASEAVCCEYWLKRPTHHHRDTSGTLEDWAQNLSVEPRQAAQYLMQQAAAKNLIQRLVISEPGIFVEISGLEMLLTENILEVVLEDANYPRGHAECTLAPGAVSYGMNAGTRFELADKSLCVVLTGQSRDQAATYGVVHKILEFLGIFSPEEQHTKFTAWDRWEPHDYLMFRRSHVDTATGGYGATKTDAQDTKLLEHLQVQRRVAFPDPAQNQQITLDEALHSRTSERKPRKPVLNLSALTFLLENSFRQTPHSTENMLRLPFPTGGAIHELRPFILVQNIEGLEPGLWYANTHTRHYEQVASCENAPHRQAHARLINTYASSARLKPEEVQGLIVTAADFGLVTATYEGVAYSLTLKHVGAWMQTACLLAEETQLNVCPLGGSDARAFETLTGIPSDTLVPVGELLVSS